VKIDTLREFAVSSQPPMRNARSTHAGVYHSHYLYVLGGVRDDRYLSECERYVCAESRWEYLPGLPVACYGMSAVVLKNSLYVLGGYGVKQTELDTVQRLDLHRLTWRLMQLKLPHAGRWSPCFKTDSQVYLVMKNTLYSFTPPRVGLIKVLPRGFDSMTSYYSRGSLYYYSRGSVYYSWYDQIKSVVLGELP
jgi:hypothetical protein